MKKIFLLIPFTASYFTSYSSTTETKQEISSPIQSAIVYLDGAEITHTATVNLSAGRNKIIFTGLSSKLVSKSVQVTASGEASILSVSDQINYLSKQAENPRIKQLKDSSELLQDNITLLNNDKDAFQTEKKMLIANQYIGGQNSGVPVASLKPAADFFRTRIMEVNAEIYKIEKKEKKLSESLNRVLQELSELNAKFNSPSAEVTVLLSSNAKITSTIILKYLVSSAGWAPIYDLRAEDIDKPIELKYRANVFNNTGVDWNEVKIKLSTADPMQSASEPKLETWYLDYEQDILYQNSQYGGSLSKSEGYLNAIPPSQQLYEYEKSNKNQDVKDKVKYEQIQVSELSAEFDIKIPYTIPADSKPYLVDVTTYNLSATYRHFSVPKMDRDAFLLARITGWEDLDLVEGPANVYYAGTFIGQSYIYTRSTDDTLNLSLGRDRKVLVTRVKQKDLTSTKYIGTNKKESYAYEITVKNNRKTAINIEVNDQIPISKEGDITVETTETSKAEYDPITGKLKWNFTLQPDEVKKVQLEFSIKYPKSKNIGKKKYRTVSAPSF